MRTLWVYHALGLVLRQAVAVLALPTAIENETSLLLAIEHSLAARDVPLVIAAGVGRREAKQGDDDRRQEQVAGEENAVGRSVSRSVVRGDEKEDVVGRSVGEWEQWDGIQMTRDVPPVRDNHFPARDM